MKGSLLALVIGAAAIAVLGTSYALSQFAFVATWAIAGLGLSLILGQAGQISLGHGAFLGIGAYVEGALAVAGWPAWASFRWRCWWPPPPVGWRRCRGGDSVAWLSR